MADKNQVVTYKTEKGDEITLTSEFVRKHLARGKAAAHVTESDAVLFMEEARYQGLNPLIKEIYLIKNSPDHPANFPVSKDTFLKRAQRNGAYGGFSAGVFVLGKDGGMTERVGSLMLPGEAILGGWAKVYRKDWSAPVEITVSVNEYKSATRPWQEMPATMIRKVAIAQAHREAFPEVLGGLYSEDELEKVIVTPVAPASPAASAPAAPLQAAPKAKAEERAAAPTMAETISSLVGEVFPGGGEEGPVQDPYRSFKMVSYKPQKTSAGAFYLDNLVLSDEAAGVTHDVGASGKTATDLAMLPLGSVVSGFLAPSTRGNNKRMVFTLEKYANVGVSASA